MGYDSRHRRSLLSSFFSRGGKFSLDASEFGTSSIAFLCYHWAVNTSSGPRPLEVFINVSSDLHEVKITCADSKQASKEPQWIDMKNVLMPLLDKLLLRRRAIVR